jgi:histidinol-phosphate aminotransferase
MSQQEEGVKQAVRLRADIAAMEGYHFATGPLEIMSERLGIPADKIIKLDTNENIYGPSPAALAALAQMIDSNQEVHIYPDALSTRLREALAEYTGIPDDHFLVGTGSDEVIDIILRLFLEPRDVIIDCPPTFSMYGLVAQWVGGNQTVHVPRRVDLTLDVEAIEQAALESGAKLLFLASPNNPDGSLVPVEVIERLLELPLVVVLDEAYWEFSKTDNLALRVPEIPNLIILRTFSKWAGLAGLRVGYGIVPLDIIQHMWKIKHPFNVNSAAELAAIATLQDLPTLRANIDKIMAEQQRLYAELQKISFLQPFPSAANFLLCRVEGLDLSLLSQELQKRGILIRYYFKGGLAGHVRITVGKPEHTDALVAALREIGEAHA